MAGGHFSVVDGLTTGRTPLSIKLDFGPVTGLVNLGQEGLVNNYRFFSLALFVTQFVYIFTPYFRILFFFDVSYSRSPLSKHFFPIF